MHTNVVTLTTTSKKPIQEQLQKYENATIKMFTTTEPTITQNVFVASSKLFDSTLNSTSSFVLTDITTTPYFTTTTSKKNLYSLTTNELITNSIVSLSTSNSLIVTSKENEISTNTLLQNIDLNPTALFPANKFIPNVNISFPAQSSTITITENKNDKKLSVKNKDFIQSAIDNATLYRSYKIGDNFASVKHLNSNIVLEENIIPLSSVKENKTKQKTDESLMNETQIQPIKLNSTLNHNKQISNTNTNIIVGEVEFVNSTSSNIEANISTIIHSEEKLQSNGKGRRWRQKSSKTFIKQNLCKQENGIICEYGCVDNLK